MTVLARVANSVSLVVQSVPSVPSVFGLYASSWADWLPMTESGKPQSGAWPQLQLQMKMLSQTNHRVCALQHYGLAASLWPRAWSPVAGLIGSSLLRSTTPASRPITSPAHDVPLHAQTAARMLFPRKLLLQLCLFLCRVEQLT